MIEAKITPKAIPKPIKNESITNQCFWLPHSSSSREEILIFAKFFVCYQISVVET